MRNYDIDNPTIATRIPDFLKEQLRIEADQNNVCLSELIRDYIIMKFSEISSKRQKEEIDFNRTVKSLNAK